MAKVKVRNVLFNILAIITVIAVLFVGLNLVCGSKGYAVTSNSMADTLNRGDIVFSKKVSFDELKAGDVITVKVGDSGYFTHRIVDINSDKKTVTTKGDANNADDPMPTEAKNIAGKMWYSVPLLGYFSIIFAGASSTTVLIILVLVAAVFVAVNTVVTKIKKTRGDSNE